MAELIRLDNISKSYGDNEVLDELTLTVEENQFVTLLGPSGCGKTTTLRIIGGFEKPDQGRVYFDGKDITDLSPNMRPLNTVFQNYALFPHMTVGENIAFGLKVSGKSDQYIKDKVKYALKLVNLKGFENRKITQLSGGQQQRICIARALAVEPEVLLMDEPTSALDPISTGKIEELMEDLKKKYTVVVVTHNMQQAVRVSDYTAFFLVGDMVEFGETKTIFSYPQDKRTEEYITGRFG